MEAFWNGFEKRAYDYAWEARDLEGRMKGRAKETPVDPKKSSMVGGLGGVSLGAIVGATKMKSPIMGGLVGAAAGGVLGAGAGYLYHLADTAGVDHAKRVMKMSPAERKEYLASAARRIYGREQEGKEHSKRLQTERHHSEMMSALRGGR